MNLASGVCDAFVYRNDSFSLLLDNIDVGRKPFIVKCI